MPIWYALCNSISVAYPKKDIHADALKSMEPWICSIRPEILMEEVDLRKKTSPAGLHDTGRWFLPAVGGFEDVANYRRQNYWYFVGQTIDLFWNSLLNMSKKWLVKSGISSSRSRRAVWRLPQLETVVQVFPKLAFLTFSLRSLL